MSKHRETRGNPNHGSNTLIVKVLEGSSLALVSRYHGQDAVGAFTFLCVARLKAASTTPSIATSFL